MKMLKQFVSAVVAVSTALTVVSMNVSATGYTDKGNADMAINKPKLTMDKVVLKKSEAAGKEITVNLSVSGAELAYVATGLHVYWDSRLELKKDDHGWPMIKRGDATQYLSGIDMHDTSELSRGMDGYFLTTSGSGNDGLDGVMWSFTFILPDDATIGDVYPMDIVYRSSANAHDLFTNVRNDTNGLNMQAYAFTKGIYSADNPTFTANANDIVKVPALANIDKTYDGYIAVGSDNLRLGDANCDGKVTQDDATAIMQSIMNPDKYSLSEQGRDNADCCNRGDGVTNMDSLAIQMVASGSLSAKDLPVKSSDL